MEWISSSTVLYILAVNGITFLAFGLDKYKAVHHRFRIREATLFTLALLGGAAACGGDGRAQQHKEGQHRRDGPEGQPVGEEPEQAFKPCGQGRRGEQGEAQRQRRRAPGGVQPDRPGAQPQAHPGRHVDLGRGLQGAERLKLCQP